MALTAATKQALIYALGPGGIAAAAEVETAIGAGTAIASGQLVVGSAGGVGVAVPVSGDATLAASGALSVAATKLATGAPVSIIKTATATVDLLAAAAATRRVIITVDVDEVFAAGNGGATTITIGEESGAADKFMLIGRLATAAARSGWIASGTLTSGKKLQATSVAATGTGTGGVTITVIAVG